MFNKPQPDQQQQTLEVILGIHQVSTVLSYVFFYELLCWLK